MPDPAKVRKQGANKRRAGADSDAGTASKLWAYALAGLLMALRGKAQPKADRPVRSSTKPDLGQQPKADLQPHPRGPDAREERRQGQRGRGRHAQTPSDIPAKGWKDILWRVYQDMSDDRLLLVAAGVTFYGLLALVPAISALVSLYGLFFDIQQVEAQVQSLSSVLPGGGLEVIGDQIKRIAAQSGGTLGLTFAISVLISLWSANSGMKAIFDALNIVYDERERRSFVRLNAQSLLFTVCAILFLILAMAAIAGVPAL